MIQDSKQRLEATEPQRSFIVQAPAGSGKTELLTQRYLRLLSTVRAPEQIVALTFTKKAASEMRERILSALTRAETCIPPTSPHQTLTNRYASEALAQAKKLNWQLLQQPNRLKVITIDALCQALIQAIPFHEQQIPYASIAENPQSLYELAVRACIADSLNQPALHKPLERLLTHLDNRQDKLMQLLTGLLITRDQWLTIIYSARHQSKETAEEALAYLIQHELDYFIDTVPIDCKEELHQLCVQVATIEANHESARYRLTTWQTFDEFDREMASSLAALLLTKDNKLRKSFDHHVGLKRGSCSNAVYDQLKAASKHLLSQLENHPDFLKSLVRAKKLPKPSYDEEQWGVLQALLTLLPLLAAHLHLTFSAANQVDFTAVSQQALLALGNDEDPTDLALHMDHCIHHMLVDEFQDTSLQQFQLLSQLVQGWLPDEGKTLFVVGDPMQSIYRFRQAEVGLFLKARQQGIGAIHLEPLELTCNFRSTTTLVDWVNKQFKTIFPVRDDIESGAVTFHPSTTQSVDTTNSLVEAYQYSHKKKEAEALSELILSEMSNHPEQTIAILVRSRSNLSAIVRVLRNKNIPFQGIEIEKLTNLPHIRDLWSLTKSLLMPANRLAWLSFLRSPWCGLGLADLHCIANISKKKSIYYALSRLNTADNLSEEGLIRATFIYQVMQKALASRHQQSLVDWLIQVIQALHGDYCHNDKERADFDQFFNLLEKHSQEGEFLAISDVETELNQLYSKKITPSQLQIMTIHKSKGLEFDCVILPGLGNKPRQNNKPLLRWMKLPTQYQEELLLLSPIRAADTEQCLLYNYVADVAAEKDRYEQQRLLYVAVTRAKKKLYLFDCHEKITQGTFRELLSEHYFSSQDTPENTELPMNPLPLLQRLPLNFYESPQPVSLPTNHPTCFPSMTTQARQSGVIAHELLQWICDKHPDTVDDLPWEFIHNRFISAGFTIIDAKEALTKLRYQINALFLDPIGQWICQHHEEEHNEYELLTLNNDQVITRIIDRTFYDKGVCWIIDFKTGKEDEESQHDHYQQVNDYALLFSNNKKHPIECGIYYLATGHWVTWTSLLETK